MTQTTFTAKEAKNNFGRLLDEARISPVTIKKNNRNFAVVISAQEYQRFEEMEDSYWATKADTAKKEGFVGAKKSMKVLNDIINA
ncbi:MAG: type II toxin-antitoxin system prevent-host-death family antitoxin [bacterium]